MTLEVPQPQGPEGFMEKAIHVAKGVGRTVVRTVLMSAHMPEQPFASHGRHFVPERTTTHPGLPNTRD